MNHPFSLRAFIILLAMCLAVSMAWAQKKGPTGTAASATPTEEWAIRLRPGTSPQQVAKLLNGRVLGRIGALEGYYLLSIKNSRQDPESVSRALEKNKSVLWSAQQLARQMEPKNLNDPKLGDQWHLNNTGQRGGTPGVDANVFNAWNLGFTGSGVQICIVDDGLEKDHDDLSPNFVLADSWDYNDKDGNDPSPNPGSSHGTACAGVAAAKGNNGVGVSGAASDADLSGIRLIDGPSSDADEAGALNYSYQNNHIYSNSWGPTDGGGYAAPGPLLKMALQEGAANGRGGLGSIYVWAAGNGRGSSDNTNYDGYVNSIYTIGVGAHGDNGIVSSYSEPGASMLVSAPSDGGAAGITTTDLNDGYMDNFGGTSSATPLVSGVIALMLEANSNLSWRDVQHILVNHATRIDPANADWTQNGAGKYINHNYGFGGVDAAALVAAAQSWTAVAAATSYTSEVVAVNRPIPDGAGAQSYGPSISETINVDQDLMLEHVELKVNIDHTYRGDLRVRLTSPSGTESVLAQVNGDSIDNLNDWYYMTVRNWGESSLGTWTITVDDGWSADIGTWVDFQLILHGVLNGECISDRAVNDLDIANGTYQASQTITSSGTVKTGSVVTFQAGQSITLQAGFSAGPGATFTASIQDCTPALYSEPAETLISPVEMATLPESEKREAVVLRLYPNPVSRQANLELWLEEEEWVSVFLMDAFGRSIHTAVDNGLLLPGKHHFVLDVSNRALSGGMYFVRASIGGKIHLKKFILLR